MSLVSLKRASEIEIGGDGDRDSVMIVIAKYIYMKSVEIDHSKKRNLEITSPSSYSRKP